MATFSDIQERLSKVIYPGFSKSIVEFGFLKDISFADDEVSVTLDIPSSAPTIEGQLKEEIKEFRESIEGLEKVLKRCFFCFNIFEGEGSLCSICKNSSRKKIPFFPFEI